MPLEDSVSDYYSIFGEEVQEIIEEVPSRILRWGVTLFFGILLLTIGLAALKNAFLSLMHLNGINLSLPQ